MADPGFPDGNTNLGPLHHGIVSWYKKSKGTIPKDAIGCTTENTTFPQQVRCSYEGRTYLLENAVLNSETKSTDKKAE